MARTKPTVITKSEPKTKPQPAWRVLSKTQEDLAELAADMIENGGHEKSIKLFIAACRHHREMRLFPERSQLAKGLESAELETANATSIDLEYRRLFKDWQQPSEDKSVAQKPQSVRDMVRSRARSVARQRFESFMKYTEGIEDVYLLGEVLLDFESDTDMGLGQAFAYQLDNWDTYMRAPYAHRIRGFVNALEAHKDDPVKVALSCKED